MNPPGVQSWMNYDCDPAPHRAVSGQRLLLVLFTGWEDVAQCCVLMVLINSLSPATNDTTMKLNYRF